MNLFCDVDWICIDLHEFEVLWNLKFHAFSQILMIFAKSWIFAFFHMGEVKNWPPKNQPQDVGLEHFYNFLWAIFNGFLKIAFFQLWPVRSRLYRLEILKIRPFGLRTRRDLTEYAKKINWFFFDFSSKFSRIISQRNRHGSGRALAHFFVGVCRWDLPIFSSIGDYGGESVCNRYNRKI